MKSDNIEILFPFIETCLIGILEKKLYVPKLILFTEFYKIANLIEKKYPMNFATFHNGAIACQRDTEILSENEKKFWSWIYNFSF